jgi:hypothetical protein
MLFKKALIDLILQGKKTMTSRSKPLYKVGVTTNLMADRDYSKISGKYIKITKVYQKALSEFADSDAHKEASTTYQNSSLRFIKLMKTPIHSGYFKGGCLLQVYLFNPVKQK